MRLFSKIAYNITATSVMVVSGLLRNKIFAAFLSINLFGILSIGQQVVSVLFTVFAFGLPLGITTLVSRLVTKSPEEQTETVSRLLVLAFTLAGILLAVLCSALLVDPYFVSRMVTATDAYTLPIAILVLSAPLMVVQSCLYAIMEGMGKVKEIIIFRILPSLLILPLLYVLASRYHLVGASIGLLANELLLSGTAIVLLRKSIRIRRSAFRLGAVSREVFKVALLSFMVGLSWFVVDFLVKRYLLDLLGELNNGIIQSVAKIVDLYPAIALSWLTMHLFPLISSNLEDRSFIGETLHRTVLIGMALVVPVIILLFAFRSQVLEIVYRKEFTVAVDYFGAMLVTGIPKVFSWIVGTALLPLGLRKQWFAASMLTTAAYAVGVVFGVKYGLSLYAIPVAFGGSLCLQGVYTLFVCREHGIRLPGDFWWGVVVACALTFLFALAVFWTPALAGALVVFGVFVYRYGLVREIQKRLHELRNKAAS